MTFKPPQAQQGKNSTNKHQEPQNSKKQPRFGTSRTERPLGTWLPERNQQQAKRLPHTNAKSPVYLCFRRLCKPLLPHQQPHAGCQKHAANGKLYDKWDTVVAFRQTSQETPPVFPLSQLPAFFTASAAPFCLAAPPAPPSPPKAAGADSTQGFGPGYDDCTGRLWATSFSRAGPPCPPLSLCMVAPIEPRAAWPPCPGTCWLGLEPRPRALLPLPGLLLMVLPAPSTPPAPGPGPIRPTLFAIEQLWPAGNTHTG